MKRLVSTLLILVFLIISVAGCSKPADDPDYNINDYKNSGGLSGLDMNGIEKEPEAKPEVKPESESKPEKEPEKTEENKVPEDADSDEVEDTRPEDSGKVDVPHTDDSKEESGYVKNVVSSIGDTVITEDSYNEDKLTFPSVHIETFDKSGIVSKTEYKNATIEINNTSKEFTKTKSAVEIRGRGNSTWLRYDKKAYKLRFSIKTDLFGMGGAKKWVLLANAFDETMLRNALAMDLAKVLELEYTTDYQFVNLFLNGEYQGLYQLCEQLEEGQTRVDINSSKTGEVDTGYLVESFSELTALKDKSFTIPEVNGLHVNEFKGKHQFVIKSPGPKEVTQEQIDFIDDYVTRANEAIFTKNWQEIEKLCDVDSFVNMFIVDQVMLNNDMGYSFYMYKKAGGKLYLGPMWDYDQSCGGSQHGGPTFEGWYAGTEHKWYTTLVKMPQFQKLVKERYNSKKAQIKDIIDSIDIKIKQNSFDFAMSNYVYNTFGDGEKWRAIPEITALTTYKMHVEYLKTWLTNRFIWMEGQFDTW